jgi:hypothetical protein
MAWNKAFNFRATATYVTDGLDTTYVIETGSNAPNQYPITRNGVTFGWLGVAGAYATRNRSLSNDVRLAGCHFANNGNSLVAKKFRVDLPAAGDYTLWLAMGDPANPATNATVAIYDGTTLIAGYGPTNLAGNQFIDATGVVRSAASWVSAGAGSPLSASFATTTLFIDVGNTASAGASPISHLFISQIEPSVGAVPFHLLFGGALSCQ